MGSHMKFRCNLCTAQLVAPPYTCLSPDFNDGMRALQRHIDDVHNGGTAVVHDVTLNVRAS